MENFVFIFFFWPLKWAIVKRTGCISFFGTGSEVQPFRNRTNRVIFRVFLLLAVWHLFPPKRCARGKYVIINVHVGDYMSLSDARIIKYFNGKIWRTQCRFYFAFFRAMVQFCWPEAPPDLPLWHTHPALEKQGMWKVEEKILIIKVVLELESTR